MKGASPQLFIDASNIRGGGGLVHLFSILQYAAPQSLNFSKVIVCSSTNVLNRLPIHPWLLKHRDALIDSNSYFNRWRWRKFRFKGVLKEYGNPILFCVGTIKPPFAYRYYTICQNLLPLEVKELMRFGFSIVTLRLLILRFVHLKAYRNAEGVIFLTAHCYEVLPARIKRDLQKHTIIHHGIDHYLFKRQNGESFDGVTRIIYVSNIDQYKHQDAVARAVINLNQKGIPVKLTLVGSSYRPSLKKLQKVIGSVANGSAWVEIEKPMSHQEQVAEYQKNTISLIASSCESFGMTLTESLAMGMTIACSNIPSFKEIAQDAAIYFDPQDVHSIEVAIEQLATNEKQRRTLSERALARAKEFTWEKAARDTFEFLSN